MSAPIRRVAALVGLLVTALVPAACATAPAAPPPVELDLPTGFSPEGIAIGNGNTGYFGSMVSGTIYQIDLTTGSGRVLAEMPGGKALGMKVDDAGRLFVAGGDRGDARVVDTRTGTVLADYRFAPPDAAGQGGGYVDDVVLTPTGAWFTDARKHQVYQVPRTPSGDLAAPAAVVTRPLRGAMDAVHSDDPQLGNSNGITTTPDGSALLIGHLSSGKVFRVDPATGSSTEVAITGGELAAPDGMFRKGRTLYVAEVFSNTVSEIELDESGQTGRIIRRETTGFDFPTAVADFGGRLYVVNASFGHAKPELGRFRVTSIPER